MKMFPLVLAFCLTTASFAIAEGEKTSNQLQKQTTKPAEPTTTGLQSSSPSSATTTNIGSQPPTNPTTNNLDAAPSDARKR